MLYDEAEYLTAVRNAIPSEYREFDINRFTDSEGNHVDVVLCREDDFRSLTDDNDVSVIPMACVAWVEGDNVVGVFEGVGDLNRVDVSDFVSGQSDVETAVSVACEQLEPWHLRAIVLEENSVLANKTQLAKTAALLEAGHSQREIATKLGLAESTTSEHVSRLNDLLRKAQWTVEHVEL